MEIRDMNRQIQKLHRRSAGRRPARPTDTRRLYRAGRESKAFALPRPTTTTATQKGAAR